MQWGPDKADERQRLMRVSRQRKAAKVKRLRIARQRQGGFLLIEMAIILTIVGMGVAAWASQARVDLVQKKLDTTRSNLATVKDALAAYKARNGFYPCPASLVATRAEASFGAATDCSAAPVAGTYDRASARTWDHDANPITPQVAYTVRYGAVPAKALDLPLELMADGYGGTLLYAVTSRMAIDEATTATMAAGALAVVDAAGNNLLESADTGQYALVSYGQDMAGAFIFGSGKRAYACGTGTAQTINCNVDVAGQPARIVAAPVSRATGAAYIDDFAAYDVAAAGTAGGGGSGAGFGLPASFAAFGTTTCPTGYKVAHTGKQIKMTSKIFNPSGSSAPVAYVDTFPEHCIPPAYLKVCGATSARYLCSSGPALTAAATYWGQITTAADCAVCIIDN